MEELADMYFSSVNSLCRGIIKEKRNFSSLLGDQWSTLPPEEQDALLDEHFVPPHIKSYYNAGEAMRDVPVDRYPVMKIMSGQKIVEDDEGETWQDEHSGPFSWKTRSQTNLFIDDAEKKPKVKDPKRPKSPRVLMRNSSNDAPGALERAGSTDFEQIRSIWESHRASSIDGEDLPFGQFVLSHSQMSLNNINDDSARRASVDLDSIYVKETEKSSAIDDESALDNASLLSLNSFNPYNVKHFAVEDENASTKSMKSFNPYDMKQLAVEDESAVPRNASTISLKSFNPYDMKQLAVEDESAVPRNASTISLKSFNPSEMNGAAAMNKADEQRGSFRSNQTTSSAQSSKSASDYHEGVSNTTADLFEGSNATAGMFEEDRLSTGSQYDNIKNNITQANAIDEPPNEDILSKYGVTFSYADNDAAQVGSSSTMSYQNPTFTSDKQKDDDTSVPSGFDFLSAW